ncbi:MAG: glycine zipper 2TM domain-containing protein [Burkholderiales bacterium]
MDTNTNTRKLHPLLTAAAISVIVFSGVGVAAITGLIPNSKGSVSDQPVAALEQPAKSETVVPPAPQTMPAPVPQATPLPPAPKKHVVRKAPAPKPAQTVAYADTPAMTPPPPVAQAPQVYEAPKPAVKPGVLGTVESVRQVEAKGDAKGVGAVGGGLAGAVLGHNIGDHNKLVTVLGAAGGALLGNQIEKQARATKQWEMTVRYDDGSTQVFKSEQAPFWHQGDRVRYYEGKLQPV